MSLLYWTGLTLFIVLTPYLLHAMITPEQF